MKILKFLEIQPFLGVSIGKFHSRASVVSKVSDGRGQKDYFSEKNSD